MGVHMRIEPYRIGLDLFKMPTLKNSSRILDLVSEEYAARY